MRLDRKKRTPLTMHSCIIPDCEERLLNDSTMCYKHFRSLPMPLRRKIWTSRNKGLDSPEYIEAIAEGVAYVAGI